MIPARVLGVPGPTCTIPLTPKAPVRIAGQRDAREGGGEAREQHKLRGGGEQAGTRPGKQAPSRRTLHGSPLTFSFSSLLSLQALEGP